jgi:hypothetical protein
VAGEARTESWGVGRLWLEGGLTDVESAGLEVDTRFPDFEDYWRPFLRGQGPAPA